MSSPGTLYASQRVNLGVGLALGIFIGLFLAIMFAALCCRPCLCKELDLEKILEKQPPASFTSVAPSGGSKNLTDVRKPNSAADVALPPKALFVDKGAMNSPP